MKYIKLFENFKNKIIYHGTSTPHKISGAHFFTEDERFACDYGHIIYKLELLTDNIFDTSLSKNIHLLYKEGFYLSDEYITMNGDEEYYPTYNFETDRFDTAEDFINSDHFGSDTWEAIEHSYGVMDWIASKYDGCLILEGGVVNYYIFEPEKNCKLIDVYKTEEQDKFPEEKEIRLEQRLKKKMPWED